MVGKSKKNKTGYLKLGKTIFKNIFVFLMMVKNNICCFGDIIGKTDLSNEMAFSKVAILAIFRFAGMNMVVVVVVVVGCSLTRRAQPDQVSGNPLEIEEKLLSSDFL